jgi:hypothetical protein
LQRLRTLMAIAGAVMSLGAVARTHSIGLSFQLDSRQGPLDVSDLNRRFGITQRSEQLSYRTEGLPGGLSFQGAFVVAHPDYSSVLVRDIKGNQTPLSALPNLVRRQETTLDAGFGWSRGPHAATLGWRGNVSQSPFASHLYRASYARGFFSQTTVLGLSASYLGQTQPESYFIDLDFRTKARPRRVHAYEVAASFDQVLSSKWKMRNQVGISRRLEERPLNVSASTRQAVALTDRLFSELVLSYADESRSQALQNERGYFRAYSVRGALTAEPLYDLLVTLSYGVFWEREQDPRSNRHVQVAADQYGLGISFAPSDWEAHLQGAYTAANTGIRQLSFTGSFMWKM